jgi:hypothetical protein
VSDLASHEELERILGACIATEVDQALIDNLRTRLGRNVTPQIDVELASNLEVVRSPRIALGVEEIDSTAAGDRNQRVGLSLFPDRLQRFEVHACKATNNLKMAKLLGSYVHQKVFAGGVLAVQALYRILHCSGEFAVRSAELF